MKRLTLNTIIELLLFLYILSIYILTFREGLNLISNGLALLLIGAIWVLFLLKKKKFVFNKFLLLHLMFILACLISSFVAIDQGVALSKVSTLILIYILMVSLVNYVDTITKIFSMMTYFVYAGFITSIYIIVISDFSNITRFGEELGNVNTIGMIIGISSLFCFYYIIVDKKYIYMIPILIVNISVILLTGSRKSFLFLLLTFIVIPLVQKNHRIKDKLKAFLGSILLIIISVYLIYNVPFFYEVVGKRIDNLLSFIFGEGTNEGSINIRVSMIEMGYDWFLNQPLTGYGIDNFRYLYGNYTGYFTYSHNNLIELLVGIGVFGTFIFYFAQIIVIRYLFKSFKIDKNFKSLCFVFIALISTYILFSVGLIYYYDKHISIILAIGSVINKIVLSEKAKTSSNN